MKNPELVQKQYVISPGPMLEKMGMKAVLKRLGVNGIPSDITNYLTSIPDELAAQLNVSLAPYGPSFCLGKPMEARINSATDLLLQTLNKHPACGALVLEPFHLDWNRIDKTRVAPLQVNRLWNEEGNKLGIGPRPDQSVQNGYTPLPQQIEEIADKLQRLKISNVFLFDDIIASGATLELLLPQIESSGLRVRGFVLSGAIYPDQKKRIKEMSLFRDMTIQAVGLPERRKTDLTVGGFNAVDCLVGGLGNTLGTKVGNELRPKMVAERSDGSPLPAGLLYGITETWRSFAPKTITGTQNSVQNEALVQLLLMNAEFWRIIEGITDRAITFGNLSRFPMGISLSPDRQTLSSNVAHTLRDLVKPLNYIPTERAKQLTVSERLRNVSTVVLDIDGTVREKNRSLVPQIFELLVDLKSNGVSVWFNTMRTKLSCQMIDDENDGLLSKTADGFIYEGGAVVERTGVTSITLVRDRNAIVTCANAFDTYVKDQQADDMFRRMIGTVGCEYFMINPFNNNLSRVEWLIENFIKENRFSPLVAVQNTGEQSIIITDPQCTKASGLKQAVGSLQNVLAVGDGASDISMFNEVNRDRGISVCVNRQRYAPNFYSLRQGTEGTLEVLELLNQIRNEK